MQMTYICVCLAYADAWHMDMLYLSCFLISPPQIRIPPKPGVTGTLKFADNLPTGTDTINLSVNNEI
ncbi:hypothetical protein NUBL17191_16860 [Klebsiella pneumoniae]|nr:hypothetical protein VNKP15269_C13370 [Klebsiella pneumoniae]GKI76433.1 hypothetical protein NUBL21976_26930 [Klebsiella pneumoniae]GKO12183.1 hypothetical protein NUBL17191_16860 [Klebsiella pneumoniae]GMW22619.1 hypothetical protein LOCUS_38070 [Klebsiella pneumoniae]GMW28518.1 hypothetical protein LOCUS_45530 [Klebsiella pneumoniae]